MTEHPTEATVFVTDPDGGDAEVSLRLTWEWEEPNQGDVPPERVRPHERKGGWIVTGVEVAG